MFIDVFIGDLGVHSGGDLVHRDREKPGEKVPLREIWERFPKFVFGYMLTFLVILLLAFSRRRLSRPLRRRWARPTSSAASSS